MMRRQRRHFQTYYLPSKSRCHSFYILGVTEGKGGGGWNPPLPVVEDQKKPKTETAVGLEMLMQTLSQTIHRRNQTTT